MPRITGLVIAELGFKAGFLLPSPPTVACHSSLLAVSPLQFTQPYTASILDSPTSYSFILLNLCSLNTAVGDRWKIAVKRTGSNILV